MKTILVIEDNPSHLKLALILLTKSGYATLQANNAELGINIAREKQPDLILMDIQLPNLDGLAATRILKADASTQAIPVIAVTSYLPEFSASEANANGCIDFIAKPYHYAELLEAVKRVLKE